MKLVGTRPALCTNCGNCEKVCSQTYFKEGNREKSAILVQEDGPGYTINVCIQCGVCMDICPTQAIVQTKNTIVIRRKDCINCLSCVGFCPTGAMRHHPDQLEPFKCVSCGSCVEECPEEAIVMETKEG